MITKGATSRPVEMSAGVLRKTMAAGERMLLVEFSIRAGSGVPLHQHPYEQVGYVVSGSQRLTVGEKTYLVEAGDAYFIPANATHGAEAVADSVIIDVFSPPRPDYMNP